MIGVLHSLIGWGGLAILGGEHLLASEIVGGELLIHKIRSLCSLGPAGR
jgi:hypothetical protein